MAAVSQNMHAACSPPLVSTAGSVKRMGVLASATSIGEPSGFANASRVTPVVAVVLLPPLGSKASEKKLVTMAESVGSRSAGIGEKEDGDPGAVNGCEVSRLPPGGSTCTSVWMVAVRVVAGAGGGAPGVRSADSSRLAAWLAARLPMTFCTASSAAELPPLSADVATESSALAMVWPTPLVASILADDTAVSTSSAALWLSTDSTTPGAAVTTASTMDAAADAASSEKLMFAVPTAIELSSCVCFSTAAEAVKLPNALVTDDTAAETSTALRFMAGGCATTGGETATPEQAGRPAAARLVFSADTNEEESEAMEVMPDAMPLAADADDTDTVKATAAPEPSRWRRATSVTPVTATATGSTLSDAAIAVLKLACAALPKVAALMPASVAEDEMVKAADITKPEGDGGDGCGGVGLGGGGSGGGGLVGNGEGGGGLGGGGLGGGNGGGLGGGGLGGGGLGGGGLGGGGLGGGGLGGGGLGGGGGGGGGLGGGGLGGGGLGGL